MSNIVTSSSFVIYIIPDSETETRKSMSKDVYICGTYSSVGELHNTDTIKTSISNS